MALSKEELLRRRFKVIADYPESGLRIGDILEDGQKEFEWWINNRDQSKWTFHPEKYPAIFRKLEWWEEREESDMPEYLLMKHQSQKVKIATKHYVKATHSLGFVDEDGSTKSYVNYLPATLEEYTQYLNSQPK